MASGSRTEDLTVTVGTDALFKINLKDSSGEVYDASGKSFSASMKKSYTASDASKIDFATEVVSAQTGVISIALTSEQTIDLDQNTRYVYDVFMYNTSSNTDITSILKGKVFVEASVTRVS